MSKQLLSPRDLATAMVTYICGKLDRLDASSDTLDAIENYITELFWTERRAAYERAALVAEKYMNFDVLVTSYIVDDIRALKGEG